MQVYGFPLSPFVRKVYVVAAEKGVAIDTVPVNPMDPPPEFLAASPFRKIPALRDGDFTLADSTAIVTYIEAMHSFPAMLPPDPRSRGKAIWWEEYADTILTPASGKIVFNRFVGPKLLGLTGDEDAAQQGETEIAPILDYFERTVPTDGWLAGDYSIGDIAVASVMTTLGCVGMAPDPAKHPATAAWYARVLERSAWRDVLAREKALMVGRAG